MDAITQGTSPAKPLRAVRPGSSGSREGRLPGPGGRSCESTLNSVALPERMDTQREVPVGIALAISALYL